MNSLPKLGNAAFVSQSEGKVYNVFQDKITIKISGEMTNGAYSISEDITPPGGGAPPHVHSREDEMFYVLEGDYEFRCGDRRFTGSRDALVHLPRDIPPRLQEHWHDGRKVPGASGTWRDGEGV